MASITLFVDLPEYATPDIFFAAFNHMPSTAPREGYKRVAISVNLPPGVLKVADRAVWSDSAQVLDGDKPTG